MPSCTSLPAQPTPPTPDRAARLLDGLLRGPGSAPGPRATRGRGRHGLRVRPGHGRAGHPRRLVVCRPSGDRRCPHHQRRAGPAASPRASLPSPPAELSGLLWEAVAGCRFDGRPLAAAWSRVPRPPDTAAAAWLAATILREHRGDGHVLAAVGAGLRGIDATLTHVATGAITREIIQPTRGWGDDDWAHPAGGFRPGDYWTGTAGSPRPGARCAAASRT